MNQAVYLIHFSRPLSHARHYAGFVNAEKRGLEINDAIAARLAEHRNGTGARICQIAVQQGIELELVKIWPNEGRKFERRLKNSGSLARVCPLCRQSTLNRMKINNKRVK